jgi:hypothetical protein
MMREFMFEEEMHQSLAGVPMAVRQKLDRVGVKIGLKQWQALGRGERLAICHLPIDHENQRETLNLFIAEAVERACGEQPKTLAESERAIAEPPHTLPAEVAAQRAPMARLDQAAWERLDADERYALINLGGGARHSHNLAAALAEFAQR